VRVFVYGVVFFCKI